MRSILPLLLLTAACSGGSDKVHTEGTPPFELDEIQSALWVIDPDTDEYRGSAALVLSDEAMDCSALTQADLYRHLDELMLEGQGLFFLFEFGTWGDEATPQSWQGLWMSGYGYGDHVDRLLWPMAFSDGFLYFLRGWYGLGSSGWVSVDAASTETVQGSYVMEYWSGEFSAENCGTWSEDEPVDTWWDSW